MGMEEGRRRCITENAADVPQRVHFLLLAAVSSTFPHVDVAQPLKKCLKLHREAKKLDTLWKVNGTTAITCKKRENMCFLSSLPLFSLCLSYHVLLLSVLLCVCDVVLCAKELAEGISH